MEQEAVQEEIRNKQKVAKFRQECAKQLEDNKRLQDQTRQKELDMDNKPATGRDLMAQIYNVKRHVSYDKRAKND
jgi:hypothetical protein